MVNKMSILQTIFLCFISAVAGATAVMAYVIHEEEKGLDDFKW